MMIQNVMVFTPVYRLQPETVAAIMALEGVGAVTLCLQRDNPYAGDRETDGPKNHLHQYQRGRELFLCGGFDAMLIIEDDIMPPVDTLARLARLNAPLAYGVYMFRHGAKIANVFERYYPWPKLARNIGESISLAHHWKDAQRKGAIECSGAGFGCLLIRREVLEAHPFEAHPDGNFFDYYWTEQVYRAGYKMMADARCHCGHIDENQEVLWPPS